jgi:nitroreductase
MMDIIEAMRIRRSVRTYQQKELPERILEKLLSGFQKNDILNDISVRLIPMKASDVEGAMTGLVGMYGRMKNSPMWIIGVSRAGDHYGENFGFRFEQFVLDCTREGLGTCWVGGFFKKSVLEKIVPKEAGEEIICISPLGYAADRRLGEKSMRLLGGLNSRKPLDERVFHGRWGNPAGEYLGSREKLHQIFELARWAPSASNMQPCHYIFDEGIIIISVLTTLHRKYPKIITGDSRMGVNFQPIDAGIAMSHVHLAARAMGIVGKWSFNFDEEKLKDAFHVPEEARVMGVYFFNN